MPNRCVIGGCSNVSNTKQGISLHFIPFAGDERPEARKRRKQWVDFVRLKRAKWDPTPNSSICSAHFAKDDFTKRFLGISNQSHWLVADEIGVAAIPKYNICIEEKPLSARAKRIIVKETMMRPDESDTETSAAVDLEPHSSKPEKDSEKEHEGSQTTEEEQPSLIFAQQVDQDADSEEDVSECEVHADEDFDYETETESDNRLEDNRFYTKSTNRRQEPKFVVFLSQLLLLFKFCPYCKADNPLVEARRTGTGVVITTNCSHPKCGRRQDVWRSQPYMPDTMVNASDFLLCFAILLSGGSASKVINLFKHMGLSSISLATFFQHQRRGCKTVAYFI